MRKLTKYVSKVAHPTKRQRLNTWDPSGGTPRRTSGMAEVEVTVLNRVLKMLERSVKVGEDLDPFPHIAKAVQDGEAPSASPTKSSKNKAAKSKTAEAKRSNSPQESGKDDTQTDEPNVSEDDFNNLERVLETARDCLLAADCCLAILTSDRLTKQVISLISLTYPLLIEHASFTRKN